METETLPQVSTEVSSVWPPLAHIIRKDDDVKKALCGAKLMGIDLPNATKVCEKCIEIAKSELS